MVVEWISHESHPSDQRLKDPPSLWYWNIELIAPKPELTLTQVVEIQVQTDTN